MPNCGKDELLVLVKTPVTLQLVINWSAQNSVAIFACLAVAHEQPIARPVDVIDCQVHALTHSQAAGVDQQQRHPITQQWHCREPPWDFFRPKHCWQGLTVAGFDLIQTLEARAFLGRSASTRPDADGNSSEPS